MTLLIGSRDWYTIYRPKNKSKTFTISEDVGMQSVLCLCKTIPTKSLTVWHTINAYHLTNVYLTDWSVDY